MSSKLLHIILFALLSVVVMVDRYEQKRESNKIDEEYSQMRAKYLADEAVIAASQMTEAPSASPSTSQYAPPPTNQMATKYLNELPPDPPDDAIVKLYTNQTKAFDCQNKSVDLLPDGGEFTLVGHCPFVRVIGPNLHVKIQHVGVLKVYGPESTVNVKQVDFIDVIAPNAHVVYGSDAYPNEKVIVQVTGPNSSAIRY